jgi:putative Holliday junction resolvase
MNSEAGVIVAFDFGLKHIGMAIGQEITNTAQTFYSLKAESGEPNWDELDIIVRDWQPKLFVVGNPINMDGSDSDMKEKSDKFSNLIRQRYNIPVELMDERLSTREARERMKSDSGHFVDASADTHQISAQIILESWFREKS